jgi:UrcA family protein
MKTIALIAAGLLAGSGLAHAQDGTTVVATSPRVERVHYQPSDLATEQGIHDLRNRVRLAADHVCAPVPGDSMIAFNELACTAPTLRNANAQVDLAVAHWRNGEQVSAGLIAVRDR